MADQGYESGVASPEHTVLLLVPPDPLREPLVRCLLAIRAVALPVSSLVHALAVLSRVDVDLVLAHASLAGPDHVRALGQDDTVPVVTIGGARSDVRLSVRDPLAAAVEPFEIALLVQRRLQGLYQGRVRWGKLTLDLRSHDAWWDEDLVHLTRAQFRIMSVLVQARGAVVSRGELCRRAMDSVGPGDQERLDAHLRRIRKLIEADHTRPEFLLTVRGTGLRLAAAAPAPTLRVEQNVSGVGSDLSGAL